MEDDKMVGDGGEEEISRIGELNLLEKATVLDRFIVEGVDWSF